jgi:flagellar biosynthetic protein FliR
MSADVTINYATLIAFLLVLARISFAFVFVPFPGMRYVPEAPKIAVALATTFALFPVWPKIASGPLAISTITLWLLSEAAFGLSVGLAVAFLTEAFVLAAQMLGLQAGYSYASTIDPTTQSDATVMQAVMQLAAGLLFFTLGLHRDVLRLFAASLERWPPGTYVITEGVAAVVRQLGSAMFSTGLRLALPVIALMLLVDISLALLGRINAQLQLLSLTFPVKMLVSIATLAVLMAAMPVVFERSARETLTAIARFSR